MLIDYQDGMFIAQIAFSERHALVRSGWTWDVTDRRWITRDPAKVGGLWVFGTDACTKALDVWRASLNGSLALSYAVDADVDIPAPDGLAYDPFQKAGILYASLRRDTLIADSPGLGKTITSIGVANITPSVRKVLVIPPAGGRINWQREWQKWCVKGLTVGIARSRARSEIVKDDGGTTLKDANGKSVRRSWTEHEWPETDVVICNYEMLPTFEQQVRARTWDLLICDEAQMLINASTIRARHILGGGANKAKKRAKITPIAARKRLFLSGTPMMTNPEDIWTLTHECDPKGLGANWKTFVYRYCAAHSTGFGLDTSGASNLEELQVKLRTAFMVRRAKEDVLKQLPPKRRQLVPLPADGLAKLVDREASAAGRLRAALADYEASLRPKVEEPPSTKPGAAGVVPWQGLEAEIMARYGGLDSMSYVERAAKLSPGELIAFEEMSTARRDLAAAKIPMVKEHVENALSSGEKVILFVVHTDVAEALREHFPGCAYITGKVPPMKRQVQVDRFQDDPDCRLMIGNIQACGTMYTLTASSWVIFAELDWVPSALEQAEDRAHRRGQQNAVLVQHLVVEGSLDCRFVEVILERTEILSEALDKKPATEFLRLSA